jgi:preprotein translocase subunit YajC
MFLGASSGSSSILIIYVVVFGGLYFFYLRPRNRKQKAARLQGRKVEVGDRAQTIGGFVGTVVNQDDDLVTLRSTSGVELEFVPTAIARKYETVVPESSDDETKNQEGDK